MVHGSLPIERTLYVSQNWFSNPKDQCRLLAYYKDVVMAKHVPVEPMPGASNCMGAVTEAFSYHQKLLELKMQQMRLKDYLESLSKMLLARQGKAAVHKAQFFSYMFT
jgi:hypothetical protein